MPLTPYGGLSVLIHLGVILWHKVFSRSATVGGLMVRKNTKFMSFCVTLIIIAVFAFVTTTATFLVKASVVDQYSSINLTEKFVVATSRMIFHEGNINNKTLLAATPIINSEVEKCLKPQVKSADLNNSIVDYLKLNGEDASLEARMLVARSSGVENYIGSGAQNLFLLEKLIDSNTCQK